MDVLYIPQLDEIGTGGGGDSGGEGGGSDGSGGTAARYRILRRVLIRPDWQRRLDDARHDRSGRGNACVPLAHVERMGLRLAAPPR